MEANLRSHLTILSAVSTVPREVDAGVDLDLRVRVACVAGCDLRGKRVEILTSDGVVQGMEVLEPGGATHPARSSFTVPTQLGHHDLTISFPRQKSGEIIHEHSAVTLGFEVIPHACRLVIWDVPLPARRGRPFKFKVGVKCSSGCQLYGHYLEVRDEEGIRIADAKLGFIPWPQSAGLYWGEVEVVAPETEGVHSWTVHFPEPDQILPHQSASSKFIFKSARPSEHTVSVSVRDWRTKAPVKDVEVMLSGLRSKTDKDGIATVRVPKGDYEICVSRGDYRSFRTEVVVDRDLEMNVELVCAASLST